jgi:hypothetical protein
MNRLALAAVLCGAALLAFLLKLDAIESSPASIFILGFAAGVAMSLGGVVAYREITARSRPRQN